MFQPDSRLVNSGKFMVVASELSFYVEPVSISPALINVFLPKQFQGDIGFSQFGMDILVIRHFKGYIPGGV